MYIETVMSNNKQIENTLEFMAGFDGCKVVSSTAPVVENFRAFVVNSDVVVSAILDKSGVNVLSALGLSGVTLKAGAFICAPRNSHFSSITLTSGSVVIYYI